MGSTQSTPPNTKAKTTEQLCADQFRAFLETKHRIDVDVERKRAFAVESVTTPDGESTWSCDGAFDITRTDAKNTIRTMKRAANENINESEYKNGNNGSRRNNCGGELWYNQKLDNTNEDLDIWVYTRRS